MNDVSPVVDFYEYLGLNRDANKEQIATQLEERRLQIQNVTKTAESSERKLQDLAQKVVYEDLSFAEKFGEVKKEEDAILVSVNRIAILNDSRLPNLRKRCAKVLDNLEEACESKVCVSLLKCCCCCGIGAFWCCGWSNDPDVQDEYLSKIEDRLLHFEGSGDKDFSSDANKKNIKEFRRFLAFIDKFLKENKKVELEFKNKPRVAVIEADCIELEKKVSVQSDLEIRKDVLEEITRRQTHRVRKNSEIFRSAEEVLMDDDTRELYEQYLNHPRYADVPQITSQSLKTLSDYEENHKNDLFAIIERFTKFIDSHKARLKKTRASRDESKYSLMYDKIVREVAEKMTLAVFNNLKSALQSSHLCLENAKDMMQVCCTRKSLLNKKVRLEYLGFMTELESACAAIYSGKKALETVEEVEEHVV